MMALAWAASGICHLVAVFRDALDVHGLPEMRCLEGVAFEVSMTMKLISPVTA